MFVRGQSGEIPMVFNLLNKILKETDSTPNKFTVKMGELVRKARHEAGLSQADLVERIYVRQASISEIENGKREVSSSEIVYLSFALNKPVLYFFPNEYIRDRPSDELSPVIQELIIQAERLSNDDLKKIITQTKALAEME